MLQTSRPDHLIPLRAFHIHLAVKQATELAQEQCGAGEAQVADVWYKVTLRLPSSGLSVNDLHSSAQICIQNHCWVGT